MMSYRERVDNPWSSGGEKINVVILIRWAEIIGIGSEFFLLQTIMVPKLLELKKKKIIYTFDI